MPSVFGDAAMTAAATDAGAVARASIGKGSAAQAYAVIARGPAPRHFALRFSFSMSSPKDLYIVHQALGTGSANFSLSLQSGTFALGVPGRTVAIGSAGADGDWHTLTYRLEGGPDGGGLVNATLDSNALAQLDLSDGTDVYNTIQLGPFWATSTPAPPLVVDYDDVTLWDCSK
jgi:hypothetical protein